MSRAFLLRWPIGWGRRCGLLATGKYSSILVHSPHRSPHRRSLHPHPIDPLGHGASALTRTLTSIHAHPDDPCATDLPTLSARLLG